jgi:hypothetical protein
MADKPLHPRICVAIGTKKKVNDEAARQREGQQGYGLNRLSLPRRLVVQLPCGVSVARISPA